MTLSLSTKDGKTIELPVKADSQHGGFAVDTSALSTGSLGERIHGSVHGHWGFEDYDGPAFEFVDAHAQTWEVAAKNAATLIVGHEESVHLQAGSVSCVDSIMLMDPDGKQLKAEWSAVKPNELEVRLPLLQAKPGAITLLVTQYGVSEPQAVQLHAFSEGTHLEHFVIHAGDSQGILTGSRLGEVASLSLEGIAFVPATVTPSQGGNALAMVAQDAKLAAALKQADTAKAKVTLQDGRTVDLNASVDAPRPSVRLIDKSVQQLASSGDSNILLANRDELPQDAKLTFSMRAQMPRTFAHDEKIEVATADESFSTALSLSSGGVTLENANVAVATLDPAKAFGPSAFGPLQFRVVANGVTGEWQPLATLVRLPVLKDLKCPSTPELACKLSGSNLYLLDSVSSDSQFGHAVQVPEGFPGYTLPVPHPIDGQLYVKLRDDPSVVNRAALATQQLPPSPEEAARAVARQAAARRESDVAANSAQQPPLGSSPQNPPAQLTPHSNDAPGQSRQLPQTDPTSNP